MLGVVKIRNRTKPLSLLWIVLYITLYLLWQQFFPGTFSPSGDYLILPFSFLAVFILSGAARGQLPGAVEHLIGRRRHNRAQRQPLENPHDERNTV
jgi:hypothetical protein